MGKKIFVPMITFPVLLYLFSCAATPAQSTSSSSNNSTAVTSSAASVSSSTNFGTGNIVIDPGNPSATIQTVPDMKLKLDDMPSSLKLKLKLKNSAPSRFSSRWRAEIQPGSLPDFKSAAWYKMYDVLNMTNNALLAFHDLKSYASNNPYIPLNTNLVVVDNWFPVNIYESVRFEPDTSNGLQAYYTIKLKMSIDYLYYLYIHVYPSTNGKAKIEIIGEENDIDDWGYTNTYGIYSSYDEDLNQSMNLYAENGFTNIEKTRISGGQVTYTAYQIYYSYTNIVLGWGNDSYGGVVNLDNSGNLATEYYNSNGGLVFQGYGTAQLSPTPVPVYGFNIKDGTQPIPNTISIYYVYDNVEGTNVIFYSNQSGQITNIDYDSTWYPYYQAAAGTNLNSGDVIYYWSDSAYSENGNFSTTEWIYTKGYTVPNTQYYFGSQYFVYGYWPLKYLTPKPAYSNYILHTTDYYDTWWMTTNLWETNSADMYQTNEDILLNPDMFYRDYVYFWNDDTGDLTYTNVYFIASTETNLIYYDFSDQNLVNSVQSQIESIYTANNSAQVVIPSLPDRSVFPKASARKPR